jgi:hypothetical protein
MSTQASNFLHEMGGDKGYHNLQNIRVNLWRRNKKQNTTTMWDQQLHGKREAVTNKR